MPSGRRLDAAFEVFDMEDAMTSLVLSRFADGSEPHGCTIRLTEVGRPTDLVPTGQVAWSTWDEQRHWVLARLGDCTVLVERSADGAAMVRVTGATVEAVRKAEAAVRANAPLAEGDPGAVEVDFWCCLGRDLHNDTRAIDAPAWADVARNYPRSVAAAFADLLAVEAPAGQGRLLLWHGPPGTGKTTAARALARAWASWCRTLFVVDPDELFGNAAYLVRLLMASGRADEDDDGPAWRLLVIEDADELLRADAKRATGQAMARLLNLADGFLGQGLNLLVLLSTNEPIGRLHPAVTRPGRCLAEIEFRAFTRAEATAWLGRPPASPAAEITLAELFHDRGDVARIGDRSPTGHPGLYL